MTRRLIALIAATTMVFAMLPAMAAMAAANSTATLLSAADVFPGAREFQVRVSNTETGLPILGGGARINAVRIVLPRHVGVTTADGTATGPNGEWTALRQDSNNLQVWNFFTSSNGIAAGSNGTFTFPTNVLPPLNGDREAPFEIAVSSNGGQTFRTAGGDVKAMIRVLEVIPGSLQPTAPNGVLDRTGTSGQQITYALGVRNHAQQNLPVTAELTSNNNDSSDPQTNTVNGLGGTHTFSIPVTLHETTSDRTSNFRGAVTAANAEAPDLFDSFVVQAAPRIQLDRNTFRDRLQDKSARYVNSRQTYEFEITGTKFNTPGLTISGGNLQIAESTFELSSGVGFAGNGSRTPLVFDAGQVIGQDGDHDGLFTLTGIDANDAVFSQEMPIRITTLLTIDNLLPEIDLKLTLPNGQDSVRQGQNVTVTGSVTNKPNAPANYFNVDFVEVFVEGIGSKTVPVSLSNGGRTFSGSVSLDAENFPVPDRDSPLNIDHPTEPNSALPFVEDVYAIAQVTDLASNSGGGTSNDETFNPYFPRLVNPGRTLLDARYDSKPVIEVEVFELTEVSGGCHPLLWRVDGATVTEVLLSNGQRCSTNSTDDGVRILKLLSDIGRTATPSAEYVPSSLPGMDRLVDTANHYTPRTVIDTITGIVPRIPLIEEVTRNNGTEIAYYDSEEETYHTRFGGDDAEVTVSRAQAGFFFEVTDCQGSVLRSVLAGGSTASAPLALGDVPAGQEATFERCLRLRNTAGPSPEQPLTMVLDKILPTIANATRAGNEVTVTFNEPVVRGTNYSSSWQAFENVENQDGPSGTDEYYYPVERVSGERGTRTLEVSFGNRGDFGGAVYEFLAMNADAKRYEDRAGNSFADQRGVPNAI